MNQPTIVITGVSSGIGYDAVRFLRDQGYFVFGSVRSDSAKQKLEADFPDRFSALVFDVTDARSVREAADIVAQQIGSRKLTALINNAGIAEGGPLQFLEDDVFRRQIEVNLVGTRNVINAFLPHLGASTDTDTEQTGPPGRIINVTSISGILNTPINGAYCVSKHAVESLGEVYRRELMHAGIDVISIQPGPIQSKLWDKNVGTLDRFHDTIYGPIIRNTDAIMRAAEKEALPAETISRLIHRIIQARKPRLSYIVHRHSWRAWILAKLLPARLTDRLLWKRLNQPLPDKEQS